MPASFEFFCKFVSFYKILDVSDGRGSMRRFAAARRNEKDIGCDT